LFYLTFIIKLYYRRIINWYMYISRGNKLFQSKVAIWFDLFVFVRIHQIVCFGPLLIYKCFLWWINQSKSI